MTSSSITTIIKMMESLPESARDRVVERLSEYIEDLRDELQWERSFEKTQAKLGEAARSAKEEIAAGKAKPLKMSDL